jgi:fermentation-respiration switch protein FrsA (DUF1100 family)
MSVFITILSIVAAVYLGLSILLFLNQSRVLYQPSRTYDYVPADYGLACEEVLLSTPDEVTLAAWYVPAEGGRWTVLFCHGNAGNISHRLDTLKMFYELGLNCLIVDYRGYGKSTGKPTEQGTLIDIMAGFQWLNEEKGLRPEELILFGRSLGGSIAATIAKDINPASLVFSRFDYNTLEAVKQVTCPVLVIHSPDDEIIPYKFGQQIFAAANEPKQFGILEGSHNEGFYDNDDMYKQIWINWLQHLDADD